MKLWPRTAASATSERSAASSSSSRAEMSAVSVSGTARSLQVVDRPVDAVLEHEPALGQEHAHRLDRVQRHAVGPGDDRVAGGHRQPRHEARQELAHRVGRDRLEVDRGEAALAGAPVGPPFEQLRAGQGQDQDRDVPGPLHQVVDEVEQPRVGVVEVLEDHHDRSASRRAARRTSATPRTAAATPRPTRARAGTASAGPIQARSASSGTCSSSIAAIAARVVASSSVSWRRARPRIISPSAQNVIPSP